MKCFVLHEDNRVPLHLYLHVDVWTTEAGAGLLGQAYHTLFPEPCLGGEQTHVPFGGIKCHGGHDLLGGETPRGHLIHLFCDNTTAVVVFQAGRDSFLQAYVCKI